jgi:hypothetical protein
VLPTAGSTRPVSSPLGGLRVATCVPIGEQRNLQSRGPRSAVAQGKAVPLPSGYHSSARKLIIAGPPLPLLGLLSARHVTIADAEETGKPLTEEVILP